MRLPASTLLLASLTALGTAACSPDVEPAGVRSRISAVVPRIVDQTAAAIEGAEPDTDQLERGLGMLDRLIPALDLGVDEDDGDLDDLERAPSRLALRADDSDLNDDGFVDSAWLVKQLNEQVFSDANQESEGVFRLRGAALCETEDFDGEPLPAEAIAACVADVDRAEIRVKAAYNGDDGLDLELLLGPTKIAPLSITLVPDSVSAELDLGATGEAIIAISKLFEVDDLPAIELAGVLAARLEVKADAHVRFAGSVKEAVKVSVSDVDGAVVFTTAVAPALIAVDANGTTRALTVAADVGATTLAAPIDGLTDEAVDRKLEVDLPGLSGTAAFTAGQPPQITGLGLGARTTIVKIDGRQAAAIDLNAADGRKLDLRFTGAADAPVVGFSPKLDLQLDLDRAALGDDAPYGVSRVLFAGVGADPSIPSLRYLQANGVSQVQVGVGRMSISTTPAQHGATIDAGQCIVDADVVQPDGTSVTVIQGAACR